MDDPKALVARGYDAIAERYAAWGSGEAGVKQRYVDRAFALVPSGRALDLGCGTGEQVTALLARRYDVTGVDISPRSVELARERVPGATFVAGDMATVSLPDASFDLVTAFFSLIHVPRDEHAAVLARIASWLRPGGVAILTMSVAGGEGTEDDWLGVPMYWSNHDAATNVALVAAAGLDVVEANEEVEDEDGEPVTTLWVVARRPA